MNYPLAVFTHQLGSFSETFIKRHIEDLLPGKTAVVTGIQSDVYGGHWTVDCPLLVLDCVKTRRLRHEILTATLKTLGISYNRQADVEEVKRFLTQNGVQVVLGEYFQLWVKWVRHIKDLGIKFFIHGHGVDVSQYLKNPHWREQYLRYNDADGVVAMSKATGARLESIGIHRDQIHVIPYGVHVPPQPARRQERQAVRSIAVGRMTGKKAPVLLLDAFRRACERTPNLYLDHVGEGDLMVAAKHFIDAFRLGERVTLHGGQLNSFAHKVMAEGDIFVQHSVTDPVTGDEEGLPVAILEAMAHAMPVVSTRHAGIPEIVIDGETGYLVDEGDTESMADRIVKLADDPDLRQKMGEAGWRRIKDHFSWEKERTSLLRILELG
jgi:colanic acid/amylovoran biosynthesis glycosyltransferase